jgi:hypothetical protein
MNKMPTLNELSGSFGEWLAKLYAKTFPGALVLHDVLINGDDGFTSQIDLILIGNKGAYVVEMKMFDDAKIYGDTQKTKWNYYKHGKKYEIYSPLKQNQKHIKYLRDFLKGFGDIPLFSIITMVCDDFKMSGENGENTIICNSLPAMERAIYKIAEGKPEVLDDIKKQEIFNYIKANQHSGKKARQDHKQRVIAYKENLEEMERQKICPYCKTEMVLRQGKNGEFYGCKNFPKCRYTLSK